MTRRRSDSERRLAGTWRRDRARPTEVLDAVLLPPSSLPEPARAYWRLRERELREQGSLKACDAELLALWCAIAAANDACYREGRLPSRDAMTAFLRASSLLGVGHDARAKLGISTARPRSEFDDLDERPRGKFDDV